MSFGLGGGQPGESERWRDEESERYGKMGSNATQSSLRLNGPWAFSFPLLQTQKDWDGAEG